MLQQAVVEGYDPIYLVGCDLGFKGVNIHGADDPDHFSVDYNRRVRESWRAPVEEETHREFHRHAQAYCQENNIRLFNATIGGELEEHPRIDFNMLFKEIPCPTP